MSYQEKPTVCQVLHSLGTGGAEMLAKRFAEGLKDEFSFVFVCLDEFGKLSTYLQDAGFQVESLERKPGVDIGCVRRLAHVLRKYDARLVHAHQYAPLFYSSLSRVPFQSVPIVFTEHGRGYPDYRRWKRVVANKLIIRPCDKIVAVGNGVKQALINNEGIPSDRIEVVYNGVDLSRFRMDLSSREATRKELEVGSNDLLIVQLARLVPLKDHETSVRAVVAAAKHGLPVQFRIVGDGPSRSAIEGLIGDLDAGSFIRFLGIRDDVERIVNAAELSILSSLTEGIPLSLIESMATGTPCVATRVGGNVEVITHGETGLLTAVGDDVAMADAIREIAQNGSLRASMGQAGRKRVEELFDESKMLDRYRNIYLEAMSNVSSKRSV